MTANRLALRPNFRLRRFAALFDVG